MIHNTSCVLNFVTHRVKITVDQEHIHCFKYNGVQCEIEMFDCNQQEAAAEWAITPLQTIVYRVEFPGESQD
jgi:hypothetical protein